MLSSCGDRLIEAVSRLRVVDWPTFKDIYASVTAGDVVTDDVAARVRRSDDLRVLDMLGYMDVNFTYGGMPLYVSPPVLYSSIDGNDVIATGARSKRLLHELTTALSGSGMSLRPPERSRFNTPTEIRISIGDMQPKDCRQLFLNAASEVGLFWCERPAASLASRLANADEEAKSIEWTLLAPPDAPSFSTEHLDFRNSSGDCPMTLYRTLDRNSSIPRFILWNGTRGGYVQPEWGRWLVLRSAQKSIIEYSQKDGALSFPRVCPLPTLHARCAALCSGRTPRMALRKNAPDMICIPGVPLAVAGHIASKLGQTLKGNLT